MNKHPFSPAALVTGLALLVIAGAFLADAAGAVHLGPREAAPLVGGCLAVAAVTAVTTSTVRAIRAIRGQGRTLDPSGEEEGSQGRP